MRWPRAPARSGRPLPSAAGRKRRMRLFAGASPAGGLRGQAGGDHGRRDGVRFRPRARSFAPDPPRRGADSPPPRRPGPGVARGPPFQASSAAPAEPFGPHRLPPWRHYDSGGPVITDGRALRWSLITNGRALRRAVAGDSAPSQPKGSRLLMTQMMLQRHMRRSAAAAGAPAIGMGAPVAGSSCQ